MIGLILDNWEDLGNLYHEYSFFGVQNNQGKGFYELNQKCKFPTISAYIHLAISKCRKNLKDSVTFTELFCADAYYAMLALKFGVDKSYGVDCNASFGISTEIAKRLKFDNYQFLCMTMDKMDTLEKTDIVANVGGLYHVSNPKEILENSYNLAKKYLVIQSVVSMSNSDENYFETPAPGWTWGGRYNKYSFDKMIRSFGWKILDSHFNELEGNGRLEDRGSVYYLIEKEMQK